MPIEAVAHGRLGASQTRCFQPPTAATRDFLAWMRGHGPTVRSPLRDELIVLTRHCVGCSEY